MYSLTYISSATTIFSPSQLEQLAAQASANNARKKITGMLLHKDGTFMQILEGERSLVLGLFAKIVVDHRHSGVMNMLQGEVNNREFSRWSMGFQNLDRVRNVRMDECAEDLKAVIQTNRSMATPSQPVKLLATFIGI